MTDSEDTRLLWEIRWIKARIFLRILFPVALLGLLGILIWGR